MPAILSAIAAVAFFSLLPAAAAGGALALPVFACLAGALSFQPGLIRIAFEKAGYFCAALLAFWAWAVAAALWNWPAGQTQAAKLALLIPLGVLFVLGASSAPTRRFSLPAGAAAFAVLAILLFIEALWDMPLNRIASPDASEADQAQKMSRGATIVLGMAWPVAAAFLGSGRTNFARAALLTTALLMAPFGLLAHAAAFGAGLAMFGLAFAAPRFAILSVSWGWAVWMLAAPFVTPLLLANTRIVDALPMSWAHRAGIWDYICARIWEQPWIGHGLDAARAIDAHIDVRGTDMPAVPLHPHSASLQIWYETGAVGAGLAALALLVGGWSLAHGLRSNRPAAAAAAATLAALGLIANVSFGAWQEWWIATLFVAAALVSALGAESVRRA